MARTLFEDVLVLDGSGADPYLGHVLVEGNRIKAIGDGRTMPPRDGAEVVDGSGATLMPGLVEAHAHCSFINIAKLEELGDIPPEEHTLLTAEMAKLLLDSGFTSACSAASGKPRLDVVIRNAINAGKIQGPRYLAASTELTVTGGLGDVRLHHLYRETFATICDGPDQFRAAAREACREGVDTLKINPSGDEFVPFAKAEQTVMNEAEVAAVAEVAQSRNKRLATHARSALSVKMSVRNGAQIIYHATFPDDESVDMLDAAKDTVFVAPAIGILYATLHDAQAWGITTEIAESIGMRREIEHAIPAMKEYKRRGIRVLPGGDYGFAWNPIGRNARDLEHFVNLFGFTPMEAIVAATKHGGELMMRGNELGQVKPGFLADILLVDGNPLDDIRILQDRNRLLAIMKDGAFHKPPVMRAQARRLAAE